MSTIQPADSSDSFFPASKTDGVKGIRDLSWPTWKLIVMLFALAVAWFGALGYRALAEPDEGRYAEIPREMAASGDFVTPRLNGIKYFEKPPLQYWATAILYRALGMSEGVARLWPALTGFLGALMAWFVTRKVIDSRTALIAALFLLCCPYYVFFSQVITLDMGVAFWISAGLLLFLLSQRSRLGSKTEFMAMLAAWAVLALAVLSKGLIGVVLPGLALGAYAVVQRDFHFLRRMHWLPGLAVFLAIATPWFVEVSRRNPEFAEFFFIHEHFARYTSTIHQREEPFWYFLPILLIGVLPWTWSAVEGIIKGWKKTSEGRAFHTERFLILWAATTLGFFSISGSKLPGYVLPAVPPLAMLAAARAVELSPQALSRRLLPGAISLGLIMLTGGFYMEHSRRGLAEYSLYANYARWIEVAGIVVLVTSAVMMFRRAQLLSSIVLCLSIVVATKLCVLGFESLSPVRSAREVAQTVRPYLKPDTLLFQVGRYDHGLPFYLDKTVPLAAVGGELEFGMRQEPTLALPTFEAFERVWRDTPSVVAIMDPASFKKMSGGDVSLHVIAQDSKRVVVVKPQ